MIKDLPEGQTHFYNDGCGEPEHNSETPCQEYKDRGSCRHQEVCNPPTKDSWQDRFDEKFTDFTEHCANTEAYQERIKAFIEQEIKLAREEDKLISFSYDNGKADYTSRDGERLLLAEKTKAFIEQVITKAKEEERRIAQESYDALRSAIEGQKMLIPIMLKEAREEEREKVYKFVRAYEEKYKGCGMADSMLALRELLTNLQDKDEIKNNL